MIKYNILKLSMPLILIRKPEIIQRNITTTYLLYKEKEKELNNSKFEIRGEVEKENNEYWIYSHNYKLESDEINHNLVGKWIIFLKNEEINKGWKIIDENVKNGNLGVSDAKISTKLSASNYKGGTLPNERVVCIYTKDYRDENEINNVRSKLRELGFKQPLCYKTDNQTIIGSYGHRSHLKCFVK